MIYLLISFVSLQEKVKAVELANIYSLRKGHKLPASYSGTPNRTPPLALRRKRAPSLHDLTPRDKAKMFEDKRKEDERLQREVTDFIYFYQLLFHFNS